MYSVVVLSNPSKPKTKKDPMKKKTHTQSKASILYVDVDQNR